MTNAAKTIDQSPIIVHKEGEEGALTIDRLTGRITTPHEERPDWAEGYAVAMLEERIKFYTDRLGSQAPTDVLEPQAIEVSDLSWIGVNADGDEVETEAEAETRMSMIASVFGMDRETGELDGIAAEFEVERQPHDVTAEELRAMEESVNAGFGVAATGLEQKTANTK